MSFLLKDNPRPPVIVFLQLHVPGPASPPPEALSLYGGEFDLLLAENGLFKARTLALGQHPHPTVADNPGGSLLWPLRGLDVPEDGEKSLRSPRFSP